MKALVLAGGLGTRLRPLTYSRPKHLLPIANVPHVHHLLALLRDHGITEVVLLTSYMADAFAPMRTMARASGIDLEVITEKSPLGTAGALKNAQNIVGDESFLALNGDILTDANLSELIAFHKDNASVATLLLTPVDDPSAFGVVPTDSDGRVSQFVEKPPPGQAPTNLINAGVYVLEPAVLSRIPSGEVWSAELHLFPDLIADGSPVFAHSSSAYWMDVGTPSTYIQANMDALSGRYRTDTIDRVDPEGVAAAPGSVVDESAQVSSACLGENARIEARARVRRAVLLPHATIAEDAVVEDSILGEGARVHAGAQVAGATVADGDEV